MDYPQEVLNIASREARKHPAQITKAVDEAEREIRALPEFEDFESMLIRSAVQSLIHDARCKDNVAIKRAFRLTPEMEQRVLRGSTVRSQERAGELYRYAIGGTALGYIKGSDLRASAANEQSVANGHAFNARLCRKLSQVVPEDKTVQESISERRLKAIFKEIGGFEKQKSALANSGVR